MDAETRYPIHEQELLAIIHALTNWRHYLHGGGGAAAGVLPEPAESWSFLDSDVVCAVTAGLSVLEDQTPATYREAMASRTKTSGKLPWTRRWRPWRR